MLNIGWGYELVYKYDEIPPTSCQHYLSQHKGPKGDHIGQGKIALFICNLSVQKRYRILYRTSDHPFVKGSRCITFVCSMQSFSLLPKSKSNQTEPNPTNTRLNPNTAQFNHGSMQLYYQQEANSSFIRGIRTKSCLF